MPKSRFWLKFLCKILPKNDQKFAQNRFFIKSLQSHLYAICLYKMEFWISFTDSEAYFRILRRIPVCIKFLGKYCKNHDFALYSDLIFHMCGQPGYVSSGYHKCCFLSKHIKNVIFYDMCMPYTQHGRLLWLMPKSRFYLKFLCKIWPKLAQIRFFSTFQKINLNVIPLTFFRILMCFCDFQPQNTILWSPRL